MPCCRAISRMISCSNGLYFENWKRAGGRRLNALLPQAARLGREVPFDLVDEVEQAAQESDHEQLVLAPVGECLVAAPSRRVARRGRRCPRGSSRRFRVWELPATRSKIRSRRSSVDRDRLTAFGGAIAELLANPGEALTMATAARERARERFLANRHFIEWTAALRGALGQASER